MVLLLLLVLLLLFELLVFRYLVWNWMKSYFPSPGLRHLCYTGSVISRPAASTGTAFQACVPKRSPMPVPGSAFYHFICTIHIFLSEKGDVACLTSPHYMNVLPDSGRTSRSFVYEIPLISPVRLYVLPLRYQSWMWSLTGLMYYLKCYHRKDHCWSWNFLIHQVRHFHRLHHRKQKYCC